MGGRGGSAAEGRGRPDGNRTGRAAEAPRKVIGPGGVTGTTGILPVARVEEEVSVSTGGTPVVPVRPDARCPSEAEPGSGLGAGCKKTPAGLTCRRLGFLPWFHFRLQPSLIPAFSFPFPPPFAVVRGLRRSMAFRTTPHLFCPAERVVLCRRYCANPRSSSAEAPAARASFGTSLSTVDSLANPPVPA